MKWVTDGVVIRSVGWNISEQGASFYLSMGRKLHGNRLMEIIITYRQRDDGVAWLDAEYIVRRGLLHRIIEKVRNCKCFTIRKS